MGLLKRALEAVFGSKLVGLTVDTIKILGVHFCYNKEARILKNLFVIIRNIQKFICLWNSKILSLEGRILIFQTLSVSKFVYFSMLTDVPNTIINKIQAFRKLFMIIFSTQ